MNEVKTNTPSKNCHYDLFLNTRSKMAVSDISSLAVYIHAKERNFTVLAFNHSRRIYMYWIIN
jgi:hypothetical protein